MLFGLLVFGAAHIGFLVIAGAEAADGMEQVVGVGPIKHFFPFDPRLLDLGIDTERITVEDNEIGVFARLQGAHAAAEVQHFSPRKRQRS